MRYKISRWQKQVFPDFYAQKFKGTRAILATYRGSRLEVIFGYELYYVEHCFLRAERNGCRYWAEQGLQKAEQVIDAAKAYPRALEEPLRVPEQAKTWTRVGQFLRFTLRRFVNARTGKTILD